jgi:hypothetical protein
MKKGPLTTAFLYQKSKVLRSGWISGWNGFIIVFRFRLNVFCAACQNKCQNYQEILPVFHSLFYLGLYIIRLITSIEHHKLVITARSVYVNGDYPCQAQCML